MDSSSQCFHDTLRNTKVYKLTSRKALTLRLSSRSVYEDSTAGIIFLGCPHLTSTDSEAWGHSQQLMKANRNKISRHNMSEFDMGQIISACRNFAGLQINVPILSIFDRRKTMSFDDLFNTLRGKPNRSSKSSCFGTSIAR